jgi:general secretion pathway protein L
MRKFTLPSLVADTLDRLAQSVDFFREHFWPAPRLRARIDGEQIVFIDAAGAPLARLSFDGAFDSPNSVALLRGRRIAIEPPAAWALRRDLPPMAGENIAFLPAFAAHHIERVTPWRLADVAYAAQTAPRADEPGKLDVAVTVVFRRRIAAALDVLAGIAAEVTLVAPASGKKAETVLPLAASPHSGGLEARRRRLGLVLAGVLACFAAVYAELAWEGAAARDEIADLDQQLDQRRVSLRRSRGGDATQPAAHGPRAVRLLDRLAKALPDEASLTELSLREGKLEIAGDTRATAALLPALEGAGFVSPAFSGPTTRNADGASDHFQIEMRVGDEK